MRVHIDLLQSLSVRSNEILGPKAFWHVRMFLCLKYTEIHVGPRLSPVSEVCVCCSLWPGWCLSNFPLYFWMCCSLPQILAPLSIPLEGLSHHLLRHSVLLASTVTCIYLWWGFLSHHITCFRFHNIHLSLSSPTLHHLVWSCYSINKCGMNEWCPSKA